MLFNGKVRTYVFRELIDMARPISKETTDEGRRGFLVMLGAVAIGRFRLPELPEAPPAPTAASSALPDETKDRIRRLIGTPSWDDDHTFLLWVEDVAGSDDSVPMMWIPETNEAREEADLFFETANWRPWTTPNELRELLRDPGPWLVRQNIMGNHYFLTTTEETVIFDPEADEVFVNDPERAVEFDSRQAASIMLRYSEEQEYDDGMIYLEPVRRVDAHRDFRSERFGL
jgi:hypothetical protein